MKGNATLIIQEALKEDIIDFNGQILPGDHTALACIPHHQEGKAKLICKAEGILAGVELAEEICRQVDDTLRLEIFLKDGAKIKHGDIAFHLFGEVKSILRAERVILNFMQRMSGIATNTARYVNLVQGTKAKILDTRKTTPALRYFEKWAVAIGGGHNHRFGLYDRIMMKDNHVDFCGGIAQAIEAVRQYQLANNLQLPVEIETRNLAEIEQVLAIGNLDRIMFDNFSVETMKEAVKLVNGRFETEASGGITLETVRAYAETGVDFISVGALTHSSGSLDLSLKAF
jgi:nicotinate-nucleotide pyrophosphorylase (carboxylating)